MPGKSEVLLHLFTTRRTNGKFQLVIKNSDHFTLWGPQSLGHLGGLSGFLSAIRKLTVRLDRSKGTLPVQRATLQKLRSQMGFW